MSWLVWLIVVVVVGYFLVKKVLPSPTKLNLATNALLAEHVLKHTVLGPENPVAKQLKDAVIQVWRHSGFPNIKEEAVVDSFNRSRRTVQLNLLAMALNELGHEPLLQGEFWQNVRNPFFPVDEAHIGAVSGRIKARHGVSLEIQQRSFKMNAWGISDG